MGGRSKWGAQQRSQQQQQQTGPNPFGNAPARTVEMLRDVMVHGDTRVLQFLAKLFALFVQTVRAAGVRRATFASQSASDMLINIKERFLMFFWLVGSFVSLFAPRWSCCINMRTPRK